MELKSVCFKRKFSINPYKNLKLHLSSMDFFKDFVNDENGDPYPLIYSQGKFCEQVKNGLYKFSGEKGGKAVRLIGAMMPYACYRMEISFIDGECGFVWIHKNDEVLIKVKKRTDGMICLLGEENGEISEIEIENELQDKISFSVQIRKSKFDVYVEKDGYSEYVHTFTFGCFGKSDAERFFMQTQTCITCSGCVEIKKAECYFDCGISQADMRPIRYENGDVLQENGKVYITASLRMHEECFQGIFSWMPGTTELTLTGVMFFDVGDGVWGNEVASSLLFDRKNGKWLLWVCNFSHGHMLAHAEFDGDPRFGVNAVDVKMMSPMPLDGTDDLFLGRFGDEDPDFIFDEENNKWLFAVCRRCDENGKYRYIFFESDSPFENYKFIGRGITGAETGGSFLRYEGKLYFICGNDFSKKSDYRIYTVPAFIHADHPECDYPDGGFRGWGTVFSVKKASRSILYWLTFDRHGGSDYQWSYGNIYCYEGIKKEE